MKKLEIKSLSLKIIVILLFIIMIIFLMSLMFELTIRVFNIDLNFAERVTTEKSFFALMRFLTLIVTIGVFISFAFAINKMLVSRIRKLNDATQEVINGNYAVQVPTRGRDELSNLTENFNKMARELQANEYLSKEFTRNISHEFKTPLATIRAYTELIETSIVQEKIDTKKIQEYASVVTDEIDRLNNLVKSILQLSSLEGTNMIKKEDTFSPAEQIRYILHLLEPQLEEKNIEFDLRLDEGKILSNKQLLYQVWQNLITNAIKFTKPDDNIKIVLASSSEGIYFEIIDHGIGILEEDKEKVFKHFYMSDKARNNEGHGLGLTISKKIVEKLGGEIGFESSNNGSKFFIRLPHN